MRIVVAPDKFKGTLTALQAATAMAAGVAEAMLDAEVRLLPVADGGEGTAAAFLAAGAERADAIVAGPLGDPVMASWARKGAVALIEAAQANGLDLITPSPRTALAASSYGVGELVALAMDAGCHEVVLAVGGSASTDGGLGMAQALGVQATDVRGRRLERGGGALIGLGSIDAGRLDPRVRGVRFTVACDVDNPLTGPSGAAAVYGPQKGAGPAEVALLDAALTRFADVLSTLDPASVPGGDRLAALAGIAGTGAAGGLSAGAIAFLGGQLTSGAELVLELVGADDVLQAADLVIVGEGSLDAQSLRGKAPGCVAAHARRAGVDVLAVAGVVAISAGELAAAGIGGAFALVDIADSAADARARAADLLAARTRDAVTWWLAHRAAG